jgi:hypothetical protein
VHPTRGTFMAACRSVKVSDKLEEAGGESTAEMEFVEANIGFSGILGSIFGIISSGLFAASQTSFMRDYTPQFVSQPWVTDVVNNTQRMIGASVIEATQTLTPSSPSSDWRTVFSVDAVATDDGLALSAVNVDDAMVNAFSLISRNAVDQTDKLNRFRRLVNVAHTLPNLPLGPAAVTDEAAVSRHRLMSAVGMAEATMGRKYNNIDDCLSSMYRVLYVFKEEADIAYANCDNALFLEIRKYATEFSKMMHDLSYRLPSKITVNFSGGVHPLVAAYVIYNDAKRHRDLEERNVIDANGRIGPLVFGVPPA